ncbi:unnamed protein product [Paramecium primaurelia]|uniref:Uncharacterized protein n=1 Tax=Paramecium primaurelia TaxID=5886 RepID=A0A8S1NU59_PARPR|nr:unnamed protein product [Paramecium primaurelia]
MKIAFTVLVVQAISNSNMMSKYPLQYGCKRSIMNIMGILNSFKSAVAQEQSDVYIGQKAECDSEIAQKDLKLKIPKVHSKLPIKMQISQHSFEKIKQTLGETEKILNTISQHISLSNDARQEDTQSYNRGAVSLNDAINTFDDSIDLANALANALAKGQASLVQVADMTTNQCNQLLLPK